MLIEKQGYIVYKASLKRDKITTLYCYLTDHLTFNTPFFQKIENEIKANIEQATKQAREDGEIPLEELSADVYAKPLEQAARGVLPWHQWELKNIKKPQNLE